MITRNNLKSFILGVLVACICVCTYISVSFRKDTNVQHKETSSPFQSTTSITTASKLSVSSKPPNDNTDIDVSNKFVARVNGEYIEAPLVASKDSTKATVTTTVDVTPLVNKMTPRWEAGIGVSYINNYVMPVVSVQRNYKHNKAVEAAIHLDKEHGNIKGATVIHKWMF